LGAPRISFPPFSIHRMVEPFVRFAVAKRPGVFASTPEEAALRVWLPSRRCQLHTS
jgi:hypothetical protein